MTLLRISVENKLALLVLSSDPFDYVAKRAAFYATFDADDLADAWDEAQRALKGPSTGRPPERGEATLNNVKIEWGTG